MDEWVLQCREGVTRELQKRDWTLVLPDELLPRVVEELCARFNDVAAIPSNAIQRATVRCYARVLFEACGQDATQAQQRAFEELWDYLYPRAAYRLHDASAAQDATQQTLVKIFQKRVTCRDAGNFLRWSEQILVREIIERFREQYERRLTERGIEYVPHEIGFEDLGENVNGDSKQTEETLEDPKQDTPAAAFTEPMREALVAALRACLQNERQVLVIVELFIQDKSFLEVAEQLQTTPLNVQVIRTRALKKLRECAEMQRLIEDWDL
jgi:RNA polymerase sigma factor (sigma-70 family)